MVKVEIYIPGKPIPKYYKKCDKCDGDRMTQNETGTRAIECTKCNGTGLLKNPYRN